MNPISSELALLLPEALLAAGICVVLVIDLFIRQQARDVTYLLTIVLLAGLAWIILGAGQGTPVLAFGGSFIADPLARVIKLFAVAVVATVFLYSRPYLRARGLHFGEYYVLGLFALLGIMVMASAFSLLVVYLGLELLSLSLYAMVAFDRDSPAASEAAMKYFVLGAIASGTLLYGMSMVYGVTGSLNIGDIHAALASGQHAVPSLWLGLAFIVAGIAFKFGAVPFHMWVPDVYEGAPVCVTLFVGTAPKLGALALALRLLVDGLPSLGSLWQPMLVALAVLSLGIGNVVAIAQTNIKRMLGYSAISHVGFILLGISTGTAAGVQAALFYTITYVIMAAGTFGCVILLSGRGVEADKLDDFKGLAQRNPWFAGMLMLMMISMIGVPPLAGFYAKWWILSALLDSGQVAIPIVALLFSVIGAFYYLRVIRLMYFESGDSGARVDMPWDMRLVLSINALLVLAIGLMPDRLLELCSRAAALV
jgi:NADH-quinone oxidoreductase subunit N